MTRARGKRKRGVHTESVKREQKQDVCGGGTSSKLHQETRAAKADTGAALGPSLVSLNTNKSPPPCATCNKGHTWVFPPSRCLGTRFSRPR
jgi:hypothetical protein